MSHYVGVRDDFRTDVRYVGDGGSRRLKLRRDVVDYSNAFDWSWYGDGTRQLAVAMLMDVMRDRKFAALHADDLALDEICYLHPQQFKLPIEVVIRWCCLCMDAFEANDARHLAQPLVPTP
jgi:hypothetical protein